MRKLAERVLFIVFKVYKVCISPLMGDRCRFYPSCSDYSYESIKKHGFIKGSFLSFKRICKCNPYHPGGIDKV